MKPTMQMQDVKKQINQSDESSPPLPGVTFIASKLVLAAVGFPRLGDPDTDHSMKNQGRENQPPLDQRQQFPRTVNQKHCPLKCLSSVEQTRVGREVHGHVQPQRHNAQQGMDSPYEKLMANKKIVLGSRLRAHLRVLTGYESTTMHP